MSVAKRLEAECPPLAGQRIVDVWAREDGSVLVLELGAGERLELWGLRPTPLLWRFVERPIGRRVQKAA